jgi:hypothetical protein
LAIGSFCFKNLHFSFDKGICEVSVKFWTVLLGVVAILRIAKIGLKSVGLLGSYIAMIELKKFLGLMELCLPVFPIAR